MYLPIECPLTESELRERWQRESSPAWVDDDLLTIVYESDAPVVYLWPVFQLPMQRVGELFVLQVHVERLNEALISYGFWEADASGQPAGRPPDPAGRYRGPDARPEVPNNRELVGSLDHLTVPSEALGDSRQVAVYRPAGFEPTEQLPVVYATDGGMAFVGYARRLDAAIENQTMPRVVVAAAHSAGTAGGLNLRGMEYLPGFDPQAFAAHRHFFTHEFPNWAEQELGVRGDRDGRAVFGCSDGAVHALALAVDEPAFAGSVIAYSGGMPPDGSSLIAPDTTPTLHLGAGTLEGPFYGASKAWADLCALAKVDHTWTETVAGHDLIQWCENLPEALARSFA